MMNPAQQSCPHYNIYKRKSGVTVTTYKSMTDVDGVSRVVSGDDADYQSCYIENSAGKTVECIK